MYRGQHRKKKNHHRSRQAALLAAFSLGLSLAAPVGLAEATTTGLTCSTAYTSPAEQETCQRFSATIDAIMRTVVPAEQAALVEDVAAGLVLNGQRLSCVLGTNCDYVPVALQAFQSLYGSHLTGLSNDPDVSEAVNAVLTLQSAPVVHEATELVGLVLTRTVGGNSTARTSSLAQELNVSLAQLLECAQVRVEYGQARSNLPGLNCETPSTNLEAVAEGAVGLVAAALMAVPSTPSSGNYVARGVGRLESDTAVVAVPGVTDSLPLSIYCSAQFDYMAAVDVEKAAFGWMNVVSQFGILKLRFDDPFLMEPNCDPPAIDFEATTVTRTTSNTGAFLASKTKTGPLSHGEGRLEYDDPGYVYGAFQKWHTDSLEWDYDFPFGFVMHMFAPPAGNFGMEGTGEATVVGSFYRFSGNRTTRDSTVQCVKYGSSDDACTIVHDDGL